MAGNRIGALKASATNRERYGQDFYRRIGQIGGRNGHTGGFASNPELARRAGRKGGRISRRGPARPITESTQESITCIGGRTHEVKSNSEKGAQSEGN